MKLPYRSEIDGLRTIAVLSVILYHAQIVVFGHNFFKGGFVGVDIFFVISGYLISRILLRELFDKGKISLIEFYERRARRILPILFTIFIFFSPFAYRYLLPDNYIEYAQSILSATAFGSNIFFYFTNAQYGAESSLLQPFLHTWSLGVEEQFYILFPILLLLAYKFTKNHLITIIAVLIIFSLQYADWLSTKNTQLNFFMLTSRLWELGIGSLLAFYELKHGRIKNELLNQTMPLLGLFLITYSVVFFSEQTPHPSFITLLPTIGTALIILYSINKMDLVGKVLSLKPIVGIGLISYSMYLWHYPIFAFARIGDTNGLHNDEKYLLIVLTLVLSVVSYFLIEKPFRNKQYLNYKKFCAIIFGILIMVISLQLAVLYNDGYKKRAGRILINKIDPPLGIVDIDHCFGNVDCEFGDNKNGVIFIVGDSIIQKISSSFVQRYKNHGYKIILMNSSACYFTTSEFTSWMGDKPRFIPGNTCDEIFQRIRHQKITKNKESIIIMGGMLDAYLEGGFKDVRGHKKIEQGILDNINSFLEENYKVVVLTPSPRPGYNVSRKIYSKILDKKIEKEALPVLKMPILEHTNRIHKAVNLLKSINHRNYFIMNLDDFFCDSKYCYLSNEGELYIQDGVHPSHFMADKISDSLVDFINNVLKIKE